MDEFLLAGYDVEELVGFGGSGEVWRARDSSTGEVVALKRLRRDGSNGMPAEQLVREAALLAAVRHDHIVALRSVVSTSDGLVLVLDYAEGGSLAAVLDVRGRLSAGEVVTIGVPVAQALGDIHARGLTHGDVTPGNVVFDGSGKPLLADLGVARLIGEGGPTGRTPGYADPANAHGPASDVHGLAAVCFSALTGVPPYGDAPHRDSEPMVVRSLGPLAPDAPAALVAAIEAGLDPDPAVRPEVAAFGRALFAACSPVAVGLARDSQRLGGTAAASTHAVPGSVRAVDASPESADTGQHRPASRLARLSPRFHHDGSTGRHRWSASRRVLMRRVIAVTSVVALLGAAVAVGIAWGWADHGHRASASVPIAMSTTSAPPTSPASAVASAAPSVADATDWLSVVGALDQSRDDAFADADANELDAVYLPGSAALATDRAALGRLISAGQRVRRLRFAIRSVQLVTQSADEVTLTVVDTLAAYDVVDAAGATTSDPGRGVRTWTVVLHAAPTSEQRWRIASIAAS